MKSAKPQKVCYLGKRRCPPVWKCRKCGRKTCEHFCGIKDPRDRSALCSGCYTRGYTARERAALFGMDEA